MGKRKEVIKMDNLQFKSIIEERMGWGHTWEVEKSDFIELLKNYPFILTETESEHLHTINYLKTFQELKQLAARRIDEMNEYIEDEFFFNKEVFSDYVKEVEAVKSMKELQSVLYFLELETSLKLTLDIDILKDPYIEYDKLEVITWKNGGAQYAFTVELGGLTI